MAELKDTFTKLKLSIIGTQTQKIDAKLDKAVQDISTYRSNSGRNGYIDLVKSLISKNTSVKLDSSSGLFSQGASGPASFGQGGRLLRYKAYQAIISNINYCHRALQVLVDNILSPDDITKISLDVKSIAKSTTSEDIPEEARVRRVKNVISKLKLENDLPLITRDTLLYGDFFCEIGDAITALTSNSLLSEAEYLSAMETTKNKRDVKTFEQIIDKEKYNFSIDYSSLLEDKDEQSGKGNRSLKNIKLIYHEPCFVLKLQSSLFPICFGYLIFPQITAIPGTSVEEDSINNIVLTILKSLETKIPQMKEFKNSDDLKYIIAQMLQQSEYNKSIEIRYVSPDKMVHFNVTSNKYKPYGESIFDNGQYSAKVLIALETALAVQRLARSTEKRKIAVEVGLPRDATKVIEKLKEEFRKRKISLDSLGNVDTIPCLDLNTQIRMTNGFAMTLGDIIQQFKNGNNNLFVYSYNFETGKIIPNKIVNAKISGKNVEVIKVILDNGKEVKCTKDHRWLMRDGTYKEAHGLKPGDSLMPFYRRTTAYSNNKLVPYEEIYHPGKKNGNGNWELTHRAFSNFLQITNTEKNVCHHKDRNPMNNHPDNYQGVTFSEHMIIHNKECIESRGKDKIIVDCICPYCGECYQTYYAPRTNFIDRHVASSKGYCDIKCWNSINKKKVVNHKVVSVEFVKEKIDVGDIEVEKFNNFGLQVGVFIHNSMITTFEDVYIPQRDGKPFVDISTFSEGNVDVGSKVEELKFIRDQLVAGLGVPPGFIGIEENVTAKNTLTEENILFARTIIAHQKYLTHQVQELIEKVFDIISPEESLTLFDTVQVTFPQPKSLQYEREARYMNEVTGLIEGLERVGIPKEYSRKKYLPQIDWDEVSRYETQSNIEKTLDPSKQDDEMGGMGGVGGMGGTPY